MTVAELIAELQKYDPDTSVLAEADNGLGPYSVSTVYVDEWKDEDFKHVVIG